MPPIGRCLPLLVLLATPAVAASTAAQWQRLFVPQVENLMGRRVYVDKASVRTGMIGRQFRQMQVLLRPNAGYPAGTLLYTDRAVDCAGSRALAYHWQIVRPDGVVLRDWSEVSPGASAVQWAGEDGLVLKYVCTGRLPR